MNRQIHSFQVSGGKLASVILGVFWLIYIASGMMAGDNWPTRHPAEWGLRGFFGWDPFREMSHHYFWRTISYRPSVVLTFASLVFITITVSAIISNYRALKKQHQMISRWSVSFFLMLLCVGFGVFLLDVIKVWEPLNDFYQEFFPPIPQGWDITQYGWPGSLSVWPRVIFLLAIWFLIHRAIKVYLPKSIDRDFLRRASLLLFVASAGLIVSGLSWTLMTKSSWIWFDSTRDSAGRTVMIAGYTVFTANRRGDLDDTKHRPRSPLSILYPSIRPE